MGSKSSKNISLKNIIKKIYFIIDYLQEYAIWNFISSKGNRFGGYPLATVFPSIRVNSVFLTSIRLFSQVVCLYISLFFKVLQ